MKKVAYSLLMFCISLIYSTSVIGIPSDGSILGGFSEGMRFFVGIAYGTITWVAVVLLRRYVFLKKNHFIIDFIFYLLLIFIVHLITNVITYLISEWPNYSLDDFLFFRYAVKTGKFNF